MGNVLSWIQRLWRYSHLEMAVLGLENAGKSTLVQIIAGNTLPYAVVPTVGFTMEHFKRDNVIIKVWDLAGSARFRSMWPRYVRGVQLVVFVVDCADRKAFATAKSAIHEIFQKPHLKDVPLLLIGNKTDLPEAASQQELFESLDLKSLQLHRDIHVVTTSCKTHENIDEVVEFLVKHST